MIPDANLTVGRHPAVRSLAAQFDVSIYDRTLQPFAVEIGHSAATMIRALPDCPELSAGLRKLLEARDCFVRAAAENVDAVRRLPS